MKNRIAIIGGGMAGLGAAYTLQKEGIPCTVFESNHKAGGRMTTEQIGDFHVDVGASFIIRYFKTVSQLVKKIDMEDELKVLARNAAALYRDGKFHTINIGKPYKSLGFKGISSKSLLTLRGQAPDLIKNFFKINSFLNAYKGLYIDDGENAYDYIKRRTCPEIADYLSDPICRAMTVYPLKDMSKLNFMVLSMSLTNMKVQAFRHGMGSVPARLSRDLDIKYKTRVTHVEQKGDRVEVAWENGESKEKGDFTAAVVAVWGDMVPKIVKGLRPVETEILNATQYSTTMPVVITMDKPMEDPFYGVYIAPGESDVMASFGVEDAKGNLGVPKGKGCLFCLTKEEYVRAFKGSKEEFGDIVLKDAMKFFPHMKSHVSGVHVFKWDRAVEKMPPGRFSLLHGMKAQWPKDRRFFIAGSYLIAPCTDGAFTSGQNAARQVTKIVN